MTTVQASRSSARKQFAIVPRSGLDFHLDEDIPKYWFGGDPFKTRFFDVLSIRLPEGERFVVSVLRGYKDEVADPFLVQQIKDFTRQEGLHSLMHRKLNARLIAQGLPMAEFDRRNAKIVDHFLSFRRPIPLAQTTASEHLTATLSHLLFENTELFESADPRVLSLFMWHAAEEIEHKSVAFNVLKTVAHVSHRRRIFTGIMMLPMFFLDTFYLMNRIFKVDGFGFRARVGLWRSGLRWLFGAKGLLRVIAPHYFSFYRRDFDPWQTGDVSNYERWLDAYDKHDDPLEASQVAMAT